jgi:predicted ATP-grasp superfamily ATP-dependent carboligase
LKRPPSEKEIVVVEKDRIRVKNSIVITGFPGPGVIANTAALHIASDLEMTEIAYLKSKLIPSMKIIIGNEFKTANLFRIYANQKNNGFLTVINEARDISSSTFWGISRTLVRWLHDKGVKEIVFIEGVMVGTVPKELKSKVFAFCTNAGRIQSLRDLGIELLPRELPLAFSGITSTMIDECINQKIPWMILFAPTSPSMSVPNFQAAAAVVKTFNKVYDLTIETEDMLRVEKAIKKKDGFFESFKKRITG